MSLSDLIRMGSRFLKPGLLLCGLLAGVSLNARAQVSSTVTSNLEQTAGTASSRRSTPVGNSMAHPDDFDKLLLESGDTLQMSVFGAPEMEQTLQVDSSGNCLVPLVGVLHLGGETTRQGEDAIRSALIEKKMFNDPQVFLEITAFTPHNVTVSGEVQSPGQIQVLAPRPLIDVLALTGGETPAAGGRVLIRHKNDDGAETVRSIPFSSKVTASDPAATTMVYPGDAVNVPRAGVVYVLGAVEKPGGYLMVNAGSLTVPQAISLANGTTIVAYMHSAIVVSRGPNGINRIEVPVGDEQQGKAEATVLHDGDILYIRTSKLKAAFINTSSIISSAASAGIVSAVNH